MFTKGGTNHDLKILYLVKKITTNHGEKQLSEICNYFSDTVEVGSLDMDIPPVVAAVGGMDKAEAGSPMDYVGGSLVDSGLAGGSSCMDCKGCNQVASGALGSLPVLDVEGMEPASWHR